MAKFKPQSPARIAANKLRRAKQHNKRMARQHIRCQWMTCARGATRKAARKDITAWKNRRKQRLQLQAGSIQGKAPTLTRVLATLERQVEW